MVHAFPDKGRKDAVRALAARVARLEETLAYFASSYDCDPDAHKYGTTCRVCESEKVLLETTT